MFRGKICEFDVLGNVLFLIGVFKKYFSNDGCVFVEKVVNLFFVVFFYLDVEND